MKEPTTFEGKREWIEALLLDLKEGAGAGSELKQLRELLACDREARVIYLQANQLDFMLSSDEARFLASKSDQARRFKFAGFPLYSGLIGVGVAAGLLIWLWSFQMTSRPGIDQTAGRSIGMLVSEHEAVFEGGGAGMSTELREGRLDLKEGRAELVFRNGVRIVLDGRCGFEIVDERTVNLEHGQLWVYCPQRVNGFRVHAPGGYQISDRGGDFGVSVGRGGLIDVHVFDGIGEVHKNEGEVRIVETGQAMIWAPDSLTAKRGKADFSRFVTSATLGRLRNEEYRDEIRKRQDLLVYYDFSGADRRTLANQADRSMPGSDAKILGGIPVEGRVKGSKALLFENSGDSLAVDFECLGYHEALTVAMWVKADRLGDNLNPLLNSNGWDAGDVHFQVTREGSLRSGVKGGRAFQTAPGVVVPGEWQLVTVAWNFRRLTARFYCNGQVLGSSPYNNFDDLIPGIVPTIGRARIGSWSPEGLQYHDMRTREFKGRIDEVMIFSRALSGGEIRELYRLGRP